jgi:integrase
MTMTNRFTFTKTKLEALTAPQDGRQYWYDSKQDGLTVCITRANTRTFYVYRWANGRPVRILIGRFPQTSVEAARKAAQSLIGEMAKGNDPQAARQARRHEQTVEGLFAYWLECAKARKAKTWTEDEHRYRRFLKPWASRKLSSIKKTDVQALFARVAKDNGPCAANRLLALIKAMFHQSPNMGFVGADPTAGVKKFKETKRDRFIHADEMQAFFRALFAEPNGTLRDILLVALLSGARKSNVMAMRWDEIDFHTTLWRIGETKTGKPVVVPLVSPLVRLLQSRRECANGGWVFPGRGRTGHITEVKSAWKRIVQAAKLTDCRPHDLRRTIASWMAIAGNGLPLIGALLGHSQPGSTAIYARLSTGPVRIAAESASSAILEAGGVKLLGHNPEK